MWELFQKILQNKISPNACLFLFSVKENVSVPFIDASKCIDELIDNGFITYIINQNTKQISITDKGNAFLLEIDNYFVKGKNKTNTQLMGSNFSEKIKKYRELFPKGKLPSGVPARNNTNALSESFRWFFQTYDYTWEEVLSATEMYIKEYKQNDYLYMMTSQYFVSKQDKHKVKKSTLADYCDMVRDVITNEEPKHFKEKVV